MLAAFEQAGDPKYLVAAKLYADKLVNKHALAPEVLPYKPDIEFLVRMTEVGGNEKYSNVAKKWFASFMKTSPTGRDEVERVLKGRSKVTDIVGYDIALGIRAALAVEQFVYARALADAVLSQRSKWLVKPTSTFGTISRAALLDAVGSLDKKTYAKAIAGLHSELLAEQGANGAWCSNETQATAYAARALASHSDPGGRAAALRGAAWLQSTLLDRGAWAHYNDGLPEPFVGDVLSAVAAEALNAVITMNQI